MKITDFISFFIAGGLLGISGQVIRIFVGLTKTSARNEPISFSRLAGSVTLGFVNGGLGIFTLSNWEPNFTMTQEHFILLISIGYAGTDFLEGLFRSLISKVGGDNDPKTMDKPPAQSNEAQLNNNFNNISAFETSFAHLSNTEPTIAYSPGVNKSVISAHAIDVIVSILKDSTNTSAKITSSARTPHEQAQAMYNNIVNQGVDAQKKLYGPYGDKVIDVFIAQKAAGKSHIEIVDAMEAKIIELGPGNVSRHCADFRKLVVVDIAPSSIANKSAFVTISNQYKTKGLLSEFLQPTDGDPAYHLEIPNKITITA
ncbi:MAG: hypothetical protein WCR52_02465 [Bacteroidota bacterium]